MSSAMPLHMRVPWWPWMHRIGAPACLPGMFTSRPAMFQFELREPVLGHIACISIRVVLPDHVMSAMSLSNAFAHASSWWPCVHRMRCSRHVYQACLSRSPAMPLLARASAGRAGIVSEWCSCHVCQPCVQHSAFAGMRAIRQWPCVHRIRCSRHVYYSYGHLSVITG